VGVRRVSLSCTIKLRLGEMNRKTTCWCVPDYYQNRLRLARFGAGDEAPVYS
jgi:hypothetical protein